MNGVAQYEAGPRAGALTGGGKEFDHRNGKDGLLEVRLPEPEEQSKARKIALK